MSVFEWLCWEEKTSVTWLALVCTLSVRVCSIIIWVHFWRHWCAVSGVQVGVWSNCIVHPSHVSWWAVACTAALLLCCFQFCCSAAYGALLACWWNIGCNRSRSNWPANCHPEQSYPLPLLPGLVSIRSATVFLIPPCRPRVNWIHHSLSSEFDSSPSHFPLPCYCVLHL